MHQRDEIIFGAGMDAIAMVEDDHIAFSRPPTHVEQAVAQSVKVVAEPVGKTEALAVHQRFVAGACVAQVDALHQATRRLGTSDQVVNITLRQVIDAGISPPG